MDEEKKSVEEQNNINEEQNNTSEEYNNGIENLNENIEEQQTNIKDIEEVVDNIDENNNIEESNINLEEQLFNLQNIEDKIEKNSEDENQNNYNEVFNNNLEGQQFKIEEKENEIEEVVVEEKNNQDDDENIDKKKAKRRKIIKFSVISFSSLLVLYLGISIYFLNHFYFGSTINTVSVFGRTVEDVDKQMADDLNKYTLVIQGKDDVKEEITAKEIGFKYNSHDKVQELKDSQNPFNWIYGVFNKKDYTLSGIASYDEVSLKQCFNNLSYFNATNEIKPQNPTFKYTDKGYEIIKEVHGNKVNKDILYNYVVNAILKGETKINLEETNCYEKAKYTSESKEVIDVKNTLNKYVSSSITYSFGDRSEVLDGATINTWLKVDENLEITLDNEKVKSYIDTLGNKYDTWGETRDFYTSSGTTVKVSGGDYGWTINRAKEVESLITAIKEGKTQTKEPIYFQTAFSRNTNDIGNTYVEIDLTKQYLWFYKNGNLIAKGNVVTGNVSSNHSTPQGTYTIDYKQKDAILRGPGYAAPVSYWMPFNQDIGIHDAVWRSAFGGNIYKTDGSHGCVNSPFSLAETIFYNIEVGTPVVCHY